MKVTILQGQMKFEPENEAEESALRALAEAGRRIRVPSYSQTTGRAQKLDYVLLEFGGPETPWKRIDEEPPPEGESVLLLEPLQRSSQPETYLPWVHYGSKVRDATHWCHCPKPFPELRGATAAEDPSSGG